MMTMKGKKNCMKKGGEVEEMEDRKGYSAGGVAKMRKGETANQMKALKKKGK